ncbi:SH3 domain containing protein [Ditylenchus destructor]|uniref:SH3 domain containing protein n=1 Tax=Ditylenchus destructor TaxID=166010 RepID=A0AAD4NIH4_9BILA|nr:SH3 domain containing protein [Ditylenchus destructor]
MTAATPNLRKGSDSGGGGRNIAVRGGPLPYGHILEVGSAIPNSDNDDNFSALPYENSSFFAFVRRRASLQYSSPLPSGVRQSAMQPAPDWTMFETAHLDQPWEFRRRVSDHLLGGRWAAGSSQVPGNGHRHSFGPYNAVATHWPHFESYGPPAVSRMQRRSQPSLIFQYQSGAPPAGAPRPVSGHARLEPLFGSVGQLRPTSNSSSSSTATLVRHPHPLGTIRHAPSQPTLPTQPGHVWKNVSQGDTTPINRSRESVGIDGHTSRSVMPHQPQQHYVPRSPQSGSPTVGRRHGHLSGHSSVGHQPGATQKRILKRCPQSDLSGERVKSYHLLKKSGFERSSPSSGSLANNSNESTPSRTDEHEIDPIYLALKQATGKYTGGTNSNQGSRRGSSAHNFGGLGGNNGAIGSSTPSPRNLSQVSLQDSGYAEAMGSRHQLNLGSTPQLDQIAGGVRAQHNSGSNNGVVHHNSGLVGGPTASRSANNRRPKLSEKMKSLSLDCAEMPPPVNTLAMRSPYKSKPIRSARGFAASGESLDYERSMSPTAPAIPSSGGGRRLPTPAANGTHVVIHEYVTQSVETALFLGDRLHIVDNGDPDWLHGFKVNDRLEQLLTFPSTCVTAVQPGEQPMKLIQNVNLTESKFRLYRDQVVFAQPDSIRDDGSVLVRNENRKFVYCPLQYLMLL